jgi:hypothetical protein
VLDPFFVLFELRDDLGVGELGEPPVVERVVADLDLSGFDEGPERLGQWVPDFAVAAVGVEGDVDAGGLGEGRVSVSAFGAVAVVDGDGNLSGCGGRGWSLPEDL